MWVRMPGSRKPEKAKKRRYIRQIGLLGAIPMLLAAGPLIGFFIGRWLDNKFGTDPILLIIFLTLGFVAAVREIIKIIKEAERDNEDNEI
jgi:F0F1-type ATP synthase assembly protein I